MKFEKSWWMSRREALKLLGIGGAAAAVPGFLPERVFAQSRKDTLILGIDISDTITLDPARLAQYTSPMTVAAAYDSLVTLKPGQYVDVQPSLATKWARTPDGKGWRFTLRDGVKFASGSPMTVDDIVWSITRVINLKDQPSQYIANIDKVVAVDAKTLDVILKKPEEPILNILAAPEFVAMERKVMEANGGTADADAKEKDKAANFVNSKSCGTGAYQVAGWERNAQIQLVRNDHYWGGKLPYARVIIRHISDGAAQLLAVRRGDIDAAFNLIPEQIKSVKGEKDVSLRPLNSLDFVYMALTQEPEFNKFLAIKENRQAIGYAIDYDGIKNNMLGGAALRPAHFLPIGVEGSTEQIARQIGFKHDPAKAKQLLAKAGNPDGFEFQIDYGNAAVQGLTYQTSRRRSSPTSPRSASRRTCARWIRSTCGRNTRRASRAAACSPSGTRRRWTTCCGPRPSCSASPSACTGRCRRTSTICASRPMSSRTPRSASTCGWSGRRSWSIRLTTSFCSSRSTRWPCATRSTSSRSPRRAGCSICTA
jgi:peptide/nickel transport system substrate-binding protein